MKKYKLNALKWISSLSGFQGGNPNSKLWFCGLEYQESDLSLALSQFDESKCSVDHPPYITEEEYKTDGHAKEKFNKNLAKIAEAYYERPLDIDNKNIFDRNSDVFKLNLYPLPLSRTNEVYSKDVYEHTGIHTKSELIALCLDNGLSDGTPSRFTNFKNLLKKHEGSVEAIICCSTMSLEYFLLAFADADNFYELREQMYQQVKVINPADVEAGGRAKYYYWCKLNRSNICLFVIPFLTGHSSSLNAVELVKIGQEIKSIVNPPKQ